MPRKTKTKKKTTKKTTKSKLNEFRTRVAIILDRSSSMGSIRDVTISTFNEQVDAIKETAKESDTRVSLVTFADHVDEPIIWNKPVKSLKKLTREDYRPSGMTAMNDAVGLTIDKLRGLPEAADEDVSFLVVIISDGLENASQEYTSQLIANRIGPLQDSGRWTFTYIGANQDLSQVSKDTGIHMDNTFAFVASAQGVNSMSVDTARATKSFFNGRLCKPGAYSKADFYDKKTGGTTTTTTTTTKKS